MDELRAALETRNLPQDGKKPELVERLRRYVVEYEADQSPVDEEDGDVMSIVQKYLPNSNASEAGDGADGRGKADYGLANRQSCGWL